VQLIDCLLEISRGCPIFDNIKFAFWIIYLQLTDIYRFLVYLPRNFWRNPILRREWIRPLLESFFSYSRPPIELKNLPSCALFWIRSQLLNIAAAGLPQLHVP
jgi:hypothetical protein